jgi:hypothetical protein
MWYVVGLFVSVPAFDRWKNLPADQEGLLLQLFADIR